MPNLKIKYIIRETLNFLKVLLDSIILFYPVKKKKFFDVCIIKVDALGDYILWLDSSYNISLKYKDKKKIFICNESIYELVKETGHFEEIYPLNLKKFQTNYFYRIIQLRKLSEFNLGISIQPTYSRNTLLGDSIIRAINSRLKIGYYGDCTNQSLFLKLIANCWYDKLLRLNYDGQHEIELNNNFLNFLDIYVIQKYKLKKLCKLERSEFNFQEKFVVISPGASDHLRTWPKEKYISLIYHLLDKYNFYVILCGSNNDNKISAFIKSKIFNKRLLNFTGRTNIKEFIEIIRFSELVIANDSSSIHVAYFLGIKSFCMSGGNSFKRFVPYSENTNKLFRPKTFYSNDCYSRNWQCCKKWKCIEKISVNEVIEEIDSYLFTKNLE